MSALMRALRRFRREEDGLIMTEFLILLPLLTWTFMALFVWWDTFRTINEAQKASYAVADMISRQKNDLPLATVNGTDDLIGMMVTGATDIRVRVTSVQWSGTQNKYFVLFSRSPGNRLPALTATDIDTLKPKIPLMAPLDSVVILETEVGYTPSFDVGLTDKVFRNFIVTRPRSLLRICLAGITCPKVT